MTNAETAAEAVRLRRAFAAMSRDAVAAEDCPPGERLWGAARGESATGNVRELRELIEHVATCGACAEAWRLAREVGPAGDARAHRPAARRWRRQPAWAAVAAAAMVVGVLTWRQPFDLPADTVRGAETAQALRVPEDGGRLSRRAPVLSWQATENATYDLVVMSEDLDRTLVNVYDLESAEYRIPDEDLHSVSAGATLWWHVKVKTSGGDSRLPTYEFILE